MDKTAQPKAVPLGSLPQSDPTPVPLNQSYSSRTQHSPTEESPLLGATVRGGQDNPDWRRIATLAYHASFIALSIFFVVRLRCTLVPFLSSDCDAEGSTEYPAEPLPSSPGVFGSPRVDETEGRKVTGQGARPLCDDDVMGSQFTVCFSSNQRL